MYGLPSYKGIDVTSFVAVTYTLIFGIMFGDLGQGLVLALCGLVILKWKKIQFGKLLFICGMSSMFFGLMFGSFFGFEEFLDPFTKRSE
jgi:V/A-type H+-transporting ATPase subunit I